MDDVSDENGIKIPTEIANERILRILQIVTCNFGRYLLSSANMFGMIFDLEKILFIKFFCQEFLWMFCSPSQPL